MYLRPWLCILNECATFMLQVLLPPKYEDVATATDHASLFTPPPSYTDVTARSD